MALPRLGGPIQLDGRVDEPAWEAVPPLPLTMYQPTHPGAPSERTEIRVAYDDEAVYVGCRLYDADPAGIRVNSLYRDRWSGDDTCVLVLDTFDDNENALWFFTTPAGIRVDRAVFNDAEPIGGAPSVNHDWNAYWDVAVTQSAEGWFAEMRIPFSSLRFQDRGGRVTMGLIVYRFIARKNERDVFPAVPPDWSMGFVKPSVAQDVVLEGVRARTPAYAAPYVLGGVAQETRLDAGGPAYVQDQRAIHEAGGDLKYSPMTNLTVDLTANTDFAQAEADDHQVNLTRFSLFFPEKRQFFQERASLFDFDVGVPDRLFYSRRIGLTDEGTPIRILGGARLVGRVGGWDVGLLDMQTARDEGFPSKNFGVARLRRQVLNPNSYAGGLLTSRVDEDGRYNVVYGLDGLLRVFDEEYLTLKWAQAFAADTSGRVRAGALERGLVRVVWQRRRERGLNYRVGLTRAGAAFEPGVGFLMRRDFFNPFAVVGYGAFLPDASSIRSVLFNGIVDLFYRNADGTLESAFVNVHGFVNMKSGATVFSGARLHEEDLPEALRLGGEAEVPAGRYRFVGYDLSYAASPGSLLGVEAAGRIGSFYDGWASGFTVEPRWNPSRHLEVSGSYDVNFVRFPSRGQRLDTHVARLRVGAALNTRVSAAALVQFSSVARTLGANVRFRYNFGEGSDLWVVLNEGLNTDRFQEAPPLPASAARTLLVKYVRTFDLRGAL